MNINERPDIIALQNVTYSIRQGTQTIVILNQVSVVWTRPCSIALRGVSGAGKSTLLSIIAGLLYPTSGLIMLGNYPLNATSTAQWDVVRSRYLGYVFQAPLLIPELSVIENVMTRCLLQGLRKADLYDEAYDLLRQLGISELAEMRPTLLSGGEQQRVSLARALLGNPPFILMDEPTAHLDSEARANFIELIKSVYCKNKVGLIIATHDPVISDAMEEVWNMHQGKLERIR